MTVFDFIASIIFTCSIQTDICHITEVQKDVIQINVCIDDQSIPPATIGIVDLDRPENQKIIKVDWSCTHL